MTDQELIKELRRALGAYPDSDLVALAEYHRARHKKLERLEDVVFEVFAARLLEPSRSIDAPPATDEQLTEWGKRPNARNRAHVCSRLLRTIARIRKDQADFEELVLEAADLRLEVAVLKAEQT